MFWKPSINMTTGIALSIICSSLAFGDTIVGKAEVYTGRILSFRNGQVEYQYHCEGGKVEPISWSELDGFRFDDDCERVSSIPSVGFYSTTVPSAPPNGKPVFKIKCKDGDEFYAKDVFLYGGIFRAASFKSDLTITCSSDELKNLVHTISYGHLTPDKIPNSASVPNGFHKVQ